MLPPKSVDENVLYRIFDRIYNIHKAIPSFQVSLVNLKTPCVLIRCSENKYDLDESYGLHEVHINIIVYVQASIRDHVVGFSFRD